MNPLRWVSIGAVALVILLGVGWCRERDARLVLTGAQREKDRQDSVEVAQLKRQLEAARDSVEVRDSIVTRTVTQWRERPPVREEPAPSAPVSAVRDWGRLLAGDNNVLRMRGDSLSRACTMLQNDCATFRARADSVIAKQDSLIRDFRARRPATPETRRNVTIGCAGGASAGYDLIHRRGYAGPGATCGLAVVF